MFTELVTPLLELLGLELVPALLLVIILIMLLRGD